MTDEDAALLGLVLDPDALGRHLDTGEQLVVVGMGIRTVGHVTVETLAWLRRADRVVHLVNDGQASRLIEELNPRSESLMGYYREGLQRAHTYEAMVEHTMRLVRAGHVVCFAAYGHPGVFAFPTHEAVRRARSEGYKARMLAAVSAEDCLFADLGVDPSYPGCLSYEATDFLLNDRALEPSSNVVLWQIGVLGNVTYSARRYDLRGLGALLDRLVPVYGDRHTVYVYEAPTRPGHEVEVVAVPLGWLGTAPLDAMSTLYIPPGAPSHPDHALAARLGLVHG